MKAAKEVTNLELYRIEKQYIEYYSNPVNLAFDTIHKTNETQKSNLKLVVNN